MTEKKRMRIIRACVSAVGCTLLSAGGACLAERPLVYAFDSFDIDAAGAAGYREGALLGQAPRSRCGWSGKKAWEGDAISVGVVSEHLKSSIKGHNATPGCGWHDPTGVNSRRTVYRELDRSVRENIYYASFILHTGWQFIEGADSSESVLVGFVNRSDLSHQPPGGTMLGFRGRFEERQLDIVARYTDGVERKERVLASNIDDGPYHLLLRVDRAPDGRTETTRYWVNPWDAASEERATETARHMGTIERQIGATDVPIDCFAVEINSWDRKFFFDEVRLTESFEGLTTDRPRSPTRRWLAYVVFAAALIAVFRTARKSSSGMKKQPQAKDDDANLQQDVLETPAIE